MNFRIAMGLVGILGLSACTAASNDMTPTIGEAALNNELDQQIAQAGAEASSSLRQIAANSGGGYRRGVGRVAPASVVVADRDLPADLRAKQTFEWNGPVENLVRTIAGRIGYAFRVAGNPPAIPPMVNISLRETSVGQALADIGLQVQNDATIVVDPPGKLLELRYEPPRASSEVFQDARHRVPRRNSAHRVRHFVSVPGK